MSGTRKYTMLGLSVLLITCLFVFFSDGDNLEYDYNGIVSDVSRSDHGFTFDLHVSDGSVFRCFSEGEPSELGHYAVLGEFSDDGNIFFIERMKNLDRST